VTTAALPGFDAETGGSGQPTTPLTTGDLVAGVAASSSPGPGSAAPTSLFAWGFAALIAAGGVWFVGQFSENGAWWLVVVILLGALIFRSGNLDKISKLSDAIGKAGQ
jgi:hypothetical protein